MIKMTRLTVLAALISLSSFACNAASANKTPSDRIQEASAQCKSFRALPEHDQLTLGAKYAAYSDAQFKEVMKTCVTPNWQQKEHYDKVAQSMVVGGAHYQTRNYNFEVGAVTTTAPVVSEDVTEPESVYYDGRPGYGRRAAPLSAEDNAQLQALLQRKSIQLLGPGDAGYQGYKGEAPRHRPVPAGCTENRVHDDVLRRTFVRVTCR